MAQVNINGIIANIEPYYQYGSSTFTSRPDTGASEPITITFSAPVLQVSLTVFDSDFEGNSVIAYSADGTVVDSQPVPYDQTPGNNNSYSLTLSSRNGKPIQTVILQPAAADFVWYGLNGTTPAVIRCTPIAGKIGSTISEVCNTNNQEQRLYESDDKTVYTDVTCTRPFSGFLNRNFVDNYFYEFGKIKFIDYCRPPLNCSSKAGEFIECDVNTPGNALFYTGRTASENTCETESRGAESSESSSECITCAPLKGVFIGCTENGIGSYYTGQIKRNSDGTTECAVETRETTTCRRIVDDCRCFIITPYQDTRSNTSYPSIATYIPCNETRTVSKKYNQPTSICVKVGSLSIAPDTSLNIPITAGTLQNPRVDQGGLCSRDGECLPPPTPTPLISTPTPTVTPIPTPQPTQIITWRSCIDGSVNNGTPPIDYRQTQFLGAGGGFCWEPRSTIGFDPGLSGALNFLYKRGSSKYPTPVTIKVTNPSYANSYKITFTTNSDIIITPKTFTLTPRSTESIIINVTPTLYDKLGDGLSNIGLDVEIVEI